MTITDKLEGLLPADGKPMTTNDRVIAEAVAELRANEAAFAEIDDQNSSEIEWLTKMVGEEQQESYRLRHKMMGLRTIKVATVAMVAALAFIAGLIAGALLGGWG